MFNTEVVGKSRPPSEPQLAFPFAGRSVPAKQPPADSSHRRPSPIPAARRALLAESSPLRAEIELEHGIAAWVPPGRWLDLRLTDNRFNMVTVRRRPDGYQVRVHRMFVGAEAKVVRALGRYIVHNDGRASGILGAFIKANENAISERPRRRRVLKVRTAGRVHDLQAIFDRLNAQRFGDQLQARITWGNRARSGVGRQRSIKMGSFALEDRVIRIHPVLDQPMVPEYFLAWIVFHEMLHGKHAAVQHAGRRWYHTKEFVAEEQSYEHFARAAAWEKEHFHRLLRSATGPRS